MLDARALVESWQKEGRAVVVGDRVSLSSSGNSDPLLKLRRAARWLAESALGTAHADLDVGEATILGSPEASVVLRKSPAWSSSILLPLLNLVLRQRMLFVGAPGRGKTTIATLMGVLAGEALTDIRRHTQHGHPQLTIADLLGGPLPKDLVEATDAKNIRVGWRGWISRRVKIVDEYNRIPTKTQSALLSLMSEGYAESFEQTIQTGASSWYLTANDELGGGTFQVIEALRDRIDVVVRAPVFHEAQVARLADRARGAPPPEERVPNDVVLTPAELDAILEVVRAVDVPLAITHALGTFAAQLDFCRRASPHVDGMSKDTLHTSGARLAVVCNEDCPLDKNEHICSQTENGVSARALMATLAFARGLAAFHGRSTVTVDDVAAVLPFTLLERLRPNSSSGFFQKAEHGAYLFDRQAWIRQLFDRSLRQQAASTSARAPAQEEARKAQHQIETIDLATARTRLRIVEARITWCLKNQELNALTWLDITSLTSVHTRLRARIAELESTS